MGSGEHKDSEADVKVALAAVPPAVRATLEKEARGGKIGDVEKEIKKGKTVYSADVVIDGKEYDVAVGEDGALLQKELDSGKDEEKDAEDKD